MAANQSGNDLNNLLSSLPSQPTTVAAQQRSNAFDNYTRGIRGNVVSGAVDALDTISTCDSVMWMNSLLTYVLTVIIILLLICVSFSFNSVFSIVLASIATIITVYQSIILSTRSCNGIFSSILGSSSIV